MGSSLALRRRQESILSGFSVSRYSSLRFCACLSGPPVNLTSLSSKARAFRRSDSEASTTVLQTNAPAGRAALKLCANVMQSSFVAWRSKRDYASPGGGDPRGLNPPGNSGARSLRCRICAEGENGFSRRRGSRWLCDAERGVVMKPPPPSSFVVAKAQFLFEFLVIPFDHPSLFDYPNQRLKFGFRRHGGKPVFGGFGLRLGPLDQSHSSRYGSARQ